MAVQCPNNDCGPRSAIQGDGRRVLTNHFEAYGNGQSGWYVGRWSDNQVAAREEVEGGEPTNYPPVFEGWRWVESGDGWQNWGGGRVTFPPPGSFDIEVVRRAVQRAIKLTSPVNAKGRRNKNGEKCDKALEKLSGGKIKSLNSLVRQYLDANGTPIVFDGSNVPMTYMDGKNQKTGTDLENIQAFVQGGKTYVNSSFFATDNPKYKGFGSTVQAFILIHEAVHQFGGMRDVDFDSNGNQASGSKQITAALVDYCFPALRALDLPGI